jgi:guanylate kinase
VVAAPSGTGKTTVCRALVDADSELVHSISHTTRAPRVGEVDGVHYHFVSEKVFRGLEKQNVFLEWAEYGGHLYGVSMCCWRLRCRVRPRSGPRATMRA